MNAVINVIMWAAYIISLYFAVFWFLVLLKNGFNHDSPRLKKTPFVTMTIPAFNEQDNIRQTMESILRLNYPKDRFELIVVNDGSTDSTSKIVQQVIKENPDFDIKLIDQENMGKGAAINRGLEIAKGEFFIVLDADSYPEEDALIKILPHFEEKNVAVVLPAMKVWKPNNMLQKIQRSEYIVNMFYKRIMSSVDCVPVIPGPFSVYRTGILRKVGGFEPRNLTEDFEITLRMHSKNHKIIQLLDPVVYTKAPATAKALYKQRNRWFKGTVLNVFKYRWLAFNKKYGDYGMMQIPTTMAAGFLALMLFGTFIYYALKPYLSFINNLFLVNFDIMTLIRNFRLDFSIFDLNFALVFSSIMMLVMTMIIVYYAHKSQKERVLEHGIIPFGIFFLGYYLLMGVFWAGVLVDFLFKKYQKW